MVYLEHQGAKFWRCVVNGTGFGVTTTYGKVGAKGRTIQKDFDTEEDAEAYLAKQEESKRQGGYQDAADPSSSSPVAAATPMTPQKRKTRTAAVVSPSPKKKGLKGHAAPDMQQRQQVGVDSGVAGVDSALASRVVLHSDYHAKLALVDPSKNSDKYYILQVLVEDYPSKRAKKSSPKTNTKRWHLFTRWGRTGTSGQAKLDGPFEEEQDAQDAFEKIFLSKVGVEWCNAKAGSQPKAGKYEYLAVSSSGSVGTWYYYLQNDPLGKPDGWYPYDEDNCQEVEDLHGTYLASNQPKRLSQRVVTSESSGFQYQVDLQAMQQTNLSSGKTRPIGRTTNGLPPPLANTKAVPVANAAPAKKKKAVGKVDKAASTALQRGTVVEEVMMNQTNLDANNNKFYKIQLIQTSPTSFNLFTRWGRVGEQGQKQEQGPFANKADGMKEYNKKFKAKSKKYTVVEIEQDEDAVLQQTAASGPTAPCQLDSDTQELVDLIFDEDMFKSAMTAMNLDPKKLPLGALSQAQVARGYDVLEKIEAEVNKSRPGRQRLTDLTSEFYTLIPHAFGRQRGPILNTAELVQEKFDMLNTLADIEMAQAMQKNRNGNDASTTPPHPSDLNFQQLAADLTLLDPQKDKDFKLIETYFNDTKAGSNMKLNKVWRVNRHKESARFAQHADLTQRKLLWHGTNVAVVAAILKSGLRIMPHSGGRVGRGIYLADQHQKSAWYVRAANGTTIMFLVEAALGEPHEIFKDDPSLTAAPAGFDAVLAKGRTQPPQEAEIDIDGMKVSVPQGKPEAVEEATNSYFDHNEFLIYKESQHRIRYILSFN